MIEGYFREGVIMKNKAARIILTITASMFIGASIVPLPIRGYALETKQEKEDYRNNKYGNNPIKMFPLNIVMT